MHSLDENKLIHSWRLQQSQEERLCHRRTVSNSRMRHARGCSQEYLRGQWKPPSGGGRTARPEKAHKGSGRGK